MNGAPIVPSILERLRTICHGLPEVHEEPAWVGLRWRIRTKTFAHVVRIEDGEPPAFARSARTAGPATVVVFRSAGEELSALDHLGHPFFVPPWRPGAIGIAGLHLDADDAPPDWDEVAELLTDSYCLLAPKRLAATVDHPPSSG
jgi:hypothetical protein